MLANWLLRLKITCAALALPPASCAKPALI
jgi:hypothetical protein